MLYVVASDQWRDGRIGVVGVIKSTTTAATADDEGEIPCERF